MENFEQQNIKSQSFQEDTLFEGRFKIVRKVAVGGMGNVYKALDRENEDFPVALKVLHRQFRSQKQYLERFTREVSYCQQVSHPNVVKIFDLYSNSEDVFFTMEYINGKSLEEILKEGLFEPSRIPKLLIEICDGLRAIHQEDIIHRDLKPGNIMLQYAKRVRNSDDLQTDTNFTGRTGSVLYNQLNPQKNNLLKSGKIIKKSDQLLKFGDFTYGSAKIIDFGISRDPSSRLTQKNIKVGSILYMAPELWMGKKATVKADFYALGCMIYELCTGKSPFISEKPMEMYLHHLNGAEPDLPSNYPEWLNQLYHQLMAKTPESRPKSCCEIIDFIKSHSEEGQVVQTFTKDMQEQTIRGGESIISVFPNANKSSHQTNGQDKTSVSNNEKSNIFSGLKTKKAQKNKLNRKTLMLSLSATRTNLEEEGIRQKTQIRRAKTVIINLPLNSALVFEFEFPTIDFLFLGVFLASLNVFDWMLTGEGISRYGVHAEGNDFLKTLMVKFGPEIALGIAKGTAILFVLFLTVMAKKSKWIKNLVGTLSLIYLFAAIIPWIYLLYYR